jgi:hypothetical protein
MGLILFSFLAGLDRDGIVSWEYNLPILYSIVTY